MSAELPCGDSADARYCPKFWEQDAEIKRLHGVVRDALCAGFEMDTEDLARWLRDHDVPGPDDEASE